ncbi:response regulator [Cohnella cellulosilytica]|uniref:Response regulator n=1 Tax=Cohnella cellulosilytica TaxID=986710 RepID=A0ABW2F6Y5_9BACL
MTLNILIVEDEPPIARSLKALIEQLPGMRVAACAEHGAEALDRLEREEIDVVFTDVSMPVMGGIELMSAIYERYPDIVTVVVSGYQDFEYVRSALQYHAFDYMLKPVFKPDLHRLLEKIAELSARRKSEAQTRQLAALLNRTTPGDELVRDALPDLPWYALAVVCAGTMPQSYSDGAIPGKSYWEQVDWGELSSSVGGNCRFWMMDGRTAAEKIVIAAFAEPRDIAEFERIYAKLPENLFVTMLVGPETRKREELADFHDALRQLLYRTVSVGQSRMIFVERSKLEARASRERGLELESAEAEALALHLRRDETEAAAGAIAGLFERCAEREVSQAELESVLQQLLHRIVKFSSGQEVHSTLPEIELGEAIAKAVSYPSLTKDVLRVYAAAAVRDQAQDTPPIVLDVERFLREHYAESITGEELSRRFGFVPSYITKLFRAHRGVSPLQYLTRVRLDKAKEIIRGEPRLMLKEIAQMVGYSDPLYFSRVFRKEVGVWPSEYKQG